ncbi:putative pentatricopeptide repeat-containing protein [Acorus gramineus]|uniref:Pentatricopeptide repeat-containing protein n=1 Tax=Acorus gramineus TaxID=55184 RepID=A0AAV9A6S7_ACOGR|nr:putative pentatricopeptide repeat-containing protein [Acorus gramineus]
MRNPKSLLSSCIRDPKTLSTLHALLTVSGTLSSPSSIADSLSRLIFSYARLPDLPSALLLFDSSPHKPISAWSAIIVSHSRHPHHLLRLYHRMISGPTTPDSPIFSVALKACAASSDLDLGRSIWARAVDSGYKGDAFVGSSAVKMFAELGAVEDARRVFEGMRRRDLVSWTSMVSGLARAGFAVNAVEIFRRMRSDGYEGDGVVMLALLRACAAIGDLRLGRSVHGRLLRRSAGGGTEIETSVVDMYVKNGEARLAVRVFEAMRGRRSAVTWGALIAGLAQNGLAADALGRLVEMQRIHGLCPDSTALVGALSACSQTGSLESGKSVHGFMTRRLGLGLELEPISATALVDMYGKCGSPGSAEAVFHRTGTKDPILWNVMISAYGAHGLGREALSLFLEMRDTGVAPDGVTFSSLLSALSHAGMVEEGLAWFERMVGEFGVHQDERHRACVVDLLARSGRVEEAKRLVESMEGELGTVVWAALLAGCLNSKGSETGLAVARRVFEARPDDVGIYALVSNAFAKAGRWELVAEARKAVKDSGRRKVPGYSAVEVDGAVHGFVMEDKSHPQFGMVKQVLGRLYQQMRRLDCAPEEEFEVLDFGKF